MSSLLLLTLLAPVCCCNQVHMTRADCPEIGILDVKSLVGIDGGGCVFPVVEEDGRDSVSVSDDASDWELDMVCGVASGCELVESIFCVSDVSAPPFDCE